MRRNSNAGFTLIETMVAVMVLAVGVLGLAAMLASSVARMNVSQDEYIAQQKAAEAVESIFTARNTGQKTWNSLCNIGSAICPAGIFTATPTQLCDPGPASIWRRWHGMQLPTNRMALVLSVKIRSQIG
jgi:prepilin-type N-terminal cleavage/methylation domain-containing protein